MKRQLAVPKDGEERAIQLTFEAKGQGHREDDYMIEDRENICVVCGSAKSLTLHHVVPYVYRQWFPLIMKSKSSRDLLLVCKNCHDLYERQGMCLKKQLASTYDFPLEGKGWIRVPKNGNARKAASALVRAHAKIPPARIEVLRKTVEDFWDEKKSEGSAIDDSGTTWKDLTWDQVLTLCCDLEDAIRGPDFVEHGEGVVKRLMAERRIDHQGKERWPALENFIKLWRQHFLDHAKPNHLSSKWSVDSEIYNND
ncbi:hypothetical protein BX666DRAFT_1883675 [Dichotomocladium elegans]|nr:hypothetical protein BX666DRAFT_1883675 [Dichotomocladium elegans]